MAARKNQPQVKNRLLLRNPTNPIATLAISPDEILEMLQKSVGHKLTTEQSLAAKTSALELLGKDDATILDLMNLWSCTPVLGEFALRLRKYFGSNLTVTPTANPRTTSVIRPVLIQWTQEI
ncbi:MAG: hypothetical protein HC852_04750 [Acaryochloridaceae cyanobacterium RU_4_10]|nr:hypothetical protein [Acaryochloridaceae cyanobacterium RU_4_10]